MDMSHENWRTLSHENWRIACKLYTPFCFERRESSIIGQYVLIGYIHLWIPYRLRDAEVEFVIFRRKDSSLPIIKIMKIIKCAKLNLRTQTETSEAEVV